MYHRTSKAIAALAWPRGRPRHFGFAACLADVKLPSPPTPSNCSLESCRRLSSTSSSSNVNGIQRIGVEDPRMSKIVIHNNGNGDTGNTGTLYMSGQTCTVSGDDVASQTQGVLDKIDVLLKEGGTDKSHVLNATIWLRDIERDFKAMNAVWNGWIDPDNKPTRATVQAHMARPQILVEIQVTSAMPSNK
jgi:enamine deaminase RidA (YjgF/YER057c/UK114 family)